VRFKLDENMPRSARQPLMANGWDVEDVHEERLAGANDDTHGLRIRFTLGAARDRAMIANGDRRAFGGFVWVKCFVKRSSAP